jgi:hypothetical protein
MFMLLIVALALILQGDRLRVVFLLWPSIHVLAFVLNPDHAKELAKAEQRFYELTKAGFTAAVRTGPSQTSQIRSFDPTAKETLFFPRVVGG